MSASPANLFDYADHYPNIPGKRRLPTSKAAAEAMKPRDKPLREQVLALLKTGEELTADEIAARLGKTVLAIRPRVAQINKLGLIVRTGYTRPNESGMQAAIWRVLEKYEGRKLIGVD